MGLFNKFRKKDKKNREVDDLFNNMENIEVTCPECKETSWRIVTKGKSQIIFCPNCLASFGVEYNDHLIIKKTIMKSSPYAEEFKKSADKVLGPLFDEKKKEELTAVHWVEKGLSYAESGLFEKAEDAYRTALRINPNYADAHNNLGVLLHVLNRLKEAEKEYRKAIIIDPNYAEAHSNLGKILYDLKRFNEAKDELKIALKLFRKQGNVQQVKIIENVLKSLF